VSQVELTIEKLIYGGDGLARLASDDDSRAKTIFVPYVLPGEKVEATIAEERPGFARADLTEVLQPSPKRTPAPCPYFGECGGCQYQHISYEEQLRLKTEILRETLRRTAKLDLDLEIQTHASPAFGYRNRTRFHLQANPDFAIGYFKHGSHELLPVRECPISSRLINRTLGQIWKLAEVSQVPEQIGEVEMFADGDDEYLMAELYLRPARISPDELNKFAGALAAAVPEICGVASFARADSRSRVPELLKPRLLYGVESISYGAAGESYRVSAGTFFQTNRFLIPSMIELAVGERKGRVALDLYSGAGLFAVPLARRFQRVIAVESSPMAVDDLRANAPENVKVSSQSTEAYLTSVADTLKPDLIIADPPRAGLGATVTTQIGRLKCSEIVYVSCDPATLARDLKQLTSDGWKIADMHLIDLFPQTFHIETCTVLQRH
jgi:23S rRNA (uracil1939-C5)-methyltransferase